VVEEALNGRGGLSRVGTNVTNGSHGVPPLFSLSWSLDRVRSRPG